MTDKYHLWIEGYKKIEGSVKNKCLEATLKMKEEFPELIRKRGHIIGAYSNRKCEHWWLATEDGTIIDPTESQFGMILEYLERDESKPAPIGKCYNCGKYVYPGAPSSNTCSSECSEEFKNSLNGNRGIQQVELINA